MRILGQIPHPQILISVFKSNNKFILKFEVGPFEQVYKFLESPELTSFEDVAALVSEDFLKDVFHFFDQMNVRYRSCISG
ncbi:MAG: hypothetical protein IPM34_09480 [Saprospiraceae bacterium]|nr:hypothetical protein [Saprospiraceae bacterium]